MAAAATLVLSGCTSAASTTAAGPPDRSHDEVQVEVDPAIAALVPSDISANGTLIVGTSPPYPPNQFHGPDGELVGFDVDVMTAAARLMGLEAQFRPTSFDSLLPAVEDEALHTAASSITVNDERLETVDFVSYFEAGIQWTAAAGTAVEPAEACGLRVAVKRGTLSDLREVPARSEACVEAGRPAIETVRYDSQDDATAAAALGTVDAMSADSPVAAYAVNESRGKLRLAGDVVAADPYGWPVRRGSDLTEALEAAAVTLVETGVLEEIAGKWGVEGGLIDDPRAWRGDPDVD